MPIPPIASKNPPRAAQMPSTDVLIRKLQNAICPVQPSDKSSSMDSSVAPDNGAASPAKAMDLRKRIDGRCIQRLVSHISEGALRVKASEVSATYPKLGIA